MSRRLSIGLALLVAGPAARLQGQTSDAQAFVDWARAAAIPMAAMTAGAEPDRAMDSLRSLLSRARVIGVGESVHEVHEFLLLRFRVLRSMAEHGELDAVVLESGLIEADELDAYVTGRTDRVDWDRALKYGLGSLTLTRETFEWLRAWNLGAGRARPVRVFGADLPSQAGSLVPALDHLVSFLADVDPSQAAWIERELRPIAQRASRAFWRPAAAAYDTLSDDARRALRSGAARLADLLDRNAARYRAATDSARYALAQRAAVVAVHMELTFRLGHFHDSNPRDVAMAANTLWALRQL